MFPMNRLHVKPQHWLATGLCALCLQAAALGLVAHQMGGFDPDQAKAHFNIPADHACMAMIAVGHPAPAEVLPDGLREKEVAPRERKYEQAGAASAAATGKLEDKKQPQAEKA